jgi:lactate racemase
MSRVAVPYGEEMLEFDVPDANLAGVVAPTLPAPIADLHRAVAEAIENPVSGPKFSALLGPGKKIAILCETHRRPTPVYKVILPILEAIKAAGAEPRIIVGCGGTREMTDVELEQKLGKEVLNSGVTVHQSQAKKKNEFRFVGVTTFGTPVAVNTYFLECDASIRIGTTQPSLWAGYGGGGSIILPGISSFETIEWGQRLITASGAKMGVTLPDNPMHADIQEAAAIAGLNMSLNVILNPDREVIDVLAGECTATHLTSIRHHRELYGFNLGSVAGGPVDVAIGGSFRWDLYFAYACRSVASLDRATKDGGTIIVASPSPGGMAHFDHIRNYVPVNKENYYRLLIDIFYGRQELWHTVVWYPTYEIMMRKQVFVVTAQKNHSLFAECGIRPFSTMKDALNAALDKNGRSARVLVAPDSRLMVPTL